MAAALPGGEDGAAGVASVEACVRTFEKISEVNKEDLAKRCNSLLSYAEDLSRFCDPGENPTAFRRCQAAAGPAAEGLLTMALEATKVEARVAAFVALARVSFGCPDNASSVVTSSLLEPAVANALRPIVEIVQQQECLAAVQMLQALAAAVPEAPMLRPLLPRVVALVSGPEDGRPACRAVRAVAVEALASCSLARQLREAVAKLLPASALSSALSEAEANGPADAFALALLLANLCDLEAPPSAAAGDDAEPEPVQTFGEIARPLWERSGFFDALGECLGAALRREQWPEGSGAYHRPWKLCGTCLRLALAGHGPALRGAVPALGAAVEARAAGAEVEDADAARAARLAAAALWELVQAEGAGGATTSSLVASARLGEALALMKEEEPAAASLLEALSYGEASTRPF